MINEDDYEMPVGFSFKLTENPIALNYFYTLDLYTKLKIKDYIQDNNSELEAMHKTNYAIENLNQGNINFLNDTYKH